MRRKLLVFLISIIIAANTLFCVSASAESEYVITVDLTNQIVTVYKQDKTVVRQMLCSAGKNNCTPTGTYILPKKVNKHERGEWIYFGQFDCYAKFATRIIGGVMFHSIPYASMRESTISKSGLAEFGSPASHGCIRLRLDDARWIALNCPAGTTCIIYKSNERDDELRAMLYEASYTGENGMSYSTYLGAPDIPGALGRNSMGQEVLNLQTRLRALGFFDGDINGNYKATTITAVKHFQRAIGVPADGIATLELQARIYASDAPTSTDVTIQAGVIGPNVKQLQQNLTDMRIYSGPIDGQYNNEIPEAIKIFQEAYGYSADGIATPVIQKAIQYELNAMLKLFNGQSYTFEKATDAIHMGVVESHGGLRVRERPSEDSNKLCRANRNTTLLLMEIDNGWAKVQIDGYTGYVKTEFLRSYDQPIGYLHYVAADGTEYNIGNSAKDFSEGKSFPSESFAVYLATVSSMIAEQDQATVTTEEPVETAEYATVSTGSDDITLNLREGPNSTADVLDTLSNGTDVLVILKGDEWSYVECPIGNGYLLNDYLSFWTGEVGLLNDGEGEDGYAEDIFAVVICNGNAKVFDADSDDAQQIGYLPNGARVSVLTSDDDWSFIDFNGNRGYMLNDDLRFIVTD